jgi:hypothetical protein
MLITVQAGATGGISTRVNLVAPPEQGLPAQSSKFNLLCWG